VGPWILGVKNGEVWPPTPPPPTPARKMERARRPEAGKYFEIPKVLGGRACGLRWVYKEGFKFTRKLNNKVGHYLCN